VGGKEGPENVNNSPQNGGTVIFSCLTAEIEYISIYSAIYPDICGSVHNSHGYRKWHPDTNGHGYQPDLADP